MSLLKITFDSASVTSKRDADVNHFLAGNQNGIIKNLAGYCAASILNNYKNQGTHVVSESLIDAEIERQIKMVEEQWRVYNEKNKK